MTKLVHIAAAFMLPKYCVIDVFITEDTPGGMSDYPQYPLCSFAV